jgi:transposase
VACLPCSDLTYAEASWTQGHEDWLGAHVRAFAYIGGCPQKLVPDNTKTAVTDASYWDPVLNRSYHALARHYGVAIVPARVRRARDRPTAENAVRLVEMWVLAPLRHRQFFALAEANAALAEKIEEWNNRPFAPPREGSRRSLFEAIERDRLKPLPTTPFIVGRWLVARVSIDYHIAVDGHFYSVPYRLVHQKLDVFLTATVVAILHNGERVASHPRSAAKAHHTTASEHMPPAHQAIARRIVPAHLQETAVELAVLADKHGLDRRLHVVIDAARAGASVKLEGAGMGIEHHLLAFARISPHERHPAMAEPDMRHLDRDRHAVHQYDLVTPVELVGLARRKAQRHIGLRRRAPARLVPHPRVAANGVIAALVTEPAQLFENPN